MSSTSIIRPEFRGTRREIGDKSVPTSLACTCPSCGEKGVFPLNHSSAHLFPNTWVSTGACPSCQFKPEFFVAFEKENEDDRLKEPVEVVMFPAPVNSLAPLELPQSLPETLKSAILDAEQSFRVGLYSPALTCGGRALEGIFKHLSSDDDVQKKLYHLIEEVCSGEAAAQPLKKLAHAIREGRNIGAHFDEKISPDEKSAFLVIELLHYIVSYFFLLPDKIAELEELVSKP